MDKCPICLSNTNFRSLRTNSDAYDVFCDKCGEYNITRSAAATDIGKYVKRYELSGAIRNLYEQGKKSYISTTNIKTFLDAVSIPSDPFDIIDLLLRSIFRKAGKPEVLIYLNPNTDYPLIYAEKPEEFIYYLTKAQELNYIERGGDRNKGCRLSLDGLRRLDELRKSEIISKQAFVAMWFDHSLDDAWKNGFKQALKYTGYDPIRIDLAEHNEKICDKIIAEIRKSGLVIADFTGQRGGVYFEAGFAMGLNTPLIWTCHKSDVKKLHFDTRQYNHIIWGNPDELCKKLINRIEATLPVKLRR